MIVNCCKPCVLGKSSTDFTLALVHSEGKYIFLGMIFERVCKDSWWKYGFIESCSVAQACLPTELLVGDSLYNSY